MQTEPVQVTKQDRDAAYELLYQLNGYLPQDTREVATERLSLLLAVNRIAASPVAPAPTTVILAPGSAIQRAVIHFSNYANDYEINCARIVEILSDFAALAPSAPHISDMPCPKCGQYSNQIFKACTCDAAPSPVATAPGRELGACEICGANGGMCKHTLAPVATATDYKRLATMLYRSLDRLSLAIESCAKIGFEESTPTTNAAHGVIWDDLNDAQKDAKLKLLHYQKLVAPVATGAGEKDES